MANISTIAIRQNLLRLTIKKAGIILLFILLSFSLLEKMKQFLASLMLTQDEYCLVSHGKYYGLIYTSTDDGATGAGMTIDNKCLVQSKWMRLAQHSVHFPSSNGEQIIDDWLWIDYHDRINVLVEAPKSNSDEEISFFILEQTKYALDTISLAVVGGIIEPRTQTDRQGDGTRLAEPAIEAAQREVSEELGVQCNNWIPLGRFRTDVNRGMGWVNPFLARDCSYSNTNNVAEARDVVGGADTEKQKVKVMGLGAVKRALMEGMFLEVQWSNTVALGILRY